ncbi:hypothetical protein HAX54_053326, partial [Datura stramonium]|nr:hypothetical protein [Datura stramonium]
AFNLKREGKELSKSMKLKKRTEALSNGTDAPPGGTRQTPAKCRSILARSGRCISGTRFSTCESPVPVPSKS